MGWLKFVIPGAGRIMTALENRAKRKHNERIAEVNLEGAKEEGKQTATMQIAQLEALRAKSPYSWPQVLFMFMLCFIVSGCILHFLYGIYIYPQDPAILGGWAYALNMLEGVPMVMGLIISVILSLMGGAVLANRLVN